ncbi:SHOCT domain-containing protein [Draconibacterium sediminis]|uniref:SHOCT domain-containing protein n=1 Tax=Draconibacterium sediminis TaxID=1544798 RepID=UPI0026ECBDF8|nr:SHOCT domain-containing protein [Draconibacterium sediminis]
MKKYYILSVLMVASTIRVFGEHRNHEMYNNGLSPIVIVLLIIVLILLGVIIYKMTTKSLKGYNYENIDPFHLIKERFAKGEINKETFIEIRDKIEDGDENEHVQTVKLRLAKGEISIAEYDEMIGLLQDE